MNNIPKLFELLNDKDISILKLSKETNISTGNICDWKNGRSRPTIPALLKLSEYFGVSIDYLLDNPVTQNKQNSEEKVSYIAEKTGINEDTVRSVLDYESEYLYKTSPAGEQKGNRNENKI